MPRIKICAKTIPKSQVFEMAFSTSIIHIFYYRIHVVRVSYKGQTKQCEGRLGLVLGLGLVHVVARKYSNSRKCGTLTFILP